MSDACPVTARSVRPPRRARQAPEAHRDLSASDKGTMREFSSLTLSAHLIGRKSWLRVPLA
jgi:hypothetical protein